MSNTTTNKVNEACIEICNSLLRGELSAVETYSKAIQKFPGTPAIAELSRIQSEHREAASRLAENVREMGGMADTDSGAWGEFAKAVQSAANLFGAESAIKSLQRGEKHGKDEYEDALEEEEVMPTCKSLIREDLLPRVNRHIQTLERLEDSVN